MGTGNLENSAAGFVTTRWSLCDAIAGDGEAAAHAGDELARIYWPAVYAFIRGRGHDRERSAELAQAFFCEVVVGRRLFERADRQLGTLRSLVRAAVRRYLIDVHRRDGARGAGARVDAGFIDDAESSFELDPAVSAERAFDQAWAVSRLREALRRCEDHFRDRGRQGHWLAFEARHLSRGPGVAVTPALREVAGRYGFASARDAASAVQIVRRRLGVILSEMTSSEGERDNSGSTHALIGL